MTSVYHTVHGWLQNHLTTITNNSILSIFKKEYQTLDDDLIVLSLNLTNRYVTKSSTG